MRHSRSVVASAFGIALVTFAGFQLRFNNATVVLLLMLVVVLQSLTGSIGASVGIASFAAGCLDFFFLPPVFSFRVDDPLDGLALFVFVIVALVVAWQVSRVRVVSCCAARYKSTELEQVYEVALRLLLLRPDEGGGVPALSAAFWEALGCTAVCLFDASTTQVSADGISRHDLAEHTRQGYIFGQDTNEPACGVFVRCLRVGNVTTGAIGFEGLADLETISPSLRVLAAAAVERARNFRRASEELAAVQAEVLRTAILDALAHEFKTPLATILAVVGGLRQSERLQEDELEMTAIIESETARLNALTTRLVQLARLDGEEVKPRVRNINIPTLVKGITFRYASQFPERQTVMSCECSHAQAPADRELLDLALTQLVDNAHKYSLPDSEVSVQIATEENSVTIRVRNEGSSIAPSERERIFERFYRGADVRKLVSGAGLGLYVARKIVVAHGGSLGLDNSTTAGTVVFSLKLPASSQAEHYAAQN